MSVILIMSYIISLVLILQPEVYVLWLPSSGTPSSTPFIYNHAWTYSSAEDRKVIWGISIFLEASPVTQTVKNLPAVRETGAQSLGWEDPLEKGMAVHSTIFAWRTPWTGAWWATAHGVARSWTRLNDFHTVFFRGRGLCHPVYQSFPPCYQSFFYGVCP